MFPRLEQGAVNRRKSKAKMIKSCQEKKGMEWDQGIRGEGARLNDDGHWRAAKSERRGKGKDTKVEGRTGVEGLFSAVLYSPATSEWREQCGTDLFNCQIYGGKASVEQQSKTWGILVYWLNEHVISQNVEFYFQQHFFWMKTLEPIWRYACVILLSHCHTHTLAAGKLSVRPNNTSVVPFLFHT